MKARLEEYKIEAAKLKFDEISNISFSFANDSRADVMAPDKSMNTSANVSAGGKDEEVIIKISKKDLEKTLDLARKNKELERTAERHFR